MRLPDPIAGRVCGGCTACCVEIGIDDPELQKPDHVPCVHMVAGQGCAIHASLPKTCRNWYCGWRFLHLSDAMRPDLSHVLLSPELGTTPFYDKGGLRVILLGEDRAALAGDELLGLIAKCVAGGVPIFLSWGHGAFAKRALVNDTVKAAVEDGDKPRFLALLNALLAALIQQVAMEAIAAQNRPAGAPRSSPSGR
jgi:hypothetical protein